MKTEASAKIQQLQCEGLTAAIVTSLDRIRFLEEQEIVEIIRSKDLPSPSCPVEVETTLVAEKELGFTISSSTPAVRLVLLSNLFAHRLIWFLRQKRKSLVMPASFPALGIVRRYWLEEGLLYAKGDRACIPSGN
ncbi:hypothetical protein M9H77_21529 [Catharanthus roseus]|uniref:Uncharacterized protein n=1 Tax=Catharanthus roseus TaxID=4058 RepID=A0ACC0ARX3_CATRO|nr:hypothetical protein M9H77_21529 [Catharanthus roseus]